MIPGSKIWTENDFCTWMRRGHISQCFSFQGSRIPGKDVGGHGESLKDDPGYFPGNVNLFMVFVLVCIVSAQELRFQPLQKSKTSKVPAGSKASVWSWQPRV